MSQHYDPSLPAVGDPGEIAIGCFKFGLTANVAGMDIHAIRQATHLTVLGAWGMTAIAEIASQEELDAEGHYQLSCALSGIKNCLELAKLLHDAAEMHRCRQRRLKAPKPTTTPSERNP